LITLITNARPSRGSRAREKNERHCFKPATPVRDACPGRNGS
jgi:hypothetical protein